MGMSEGLRCSSRGSHYLPLPKVILRPSLANMTLSASHTETSVMAPLNHNFSCVPFDNFMHATTGRCVRPFSLPPTRRRHCRRGSTHKHVGRTSRNRYGGDVGDSQPDRWPPDCDQREFIHFRPYCRVIFNFLSMEKWTQR